MAQPTSNDKARRDTRAARYARLHALMFAGAALGTTVLLLGMTAEPKFPRFVGE
jgi:hypothetical protein